MSREAAYLLDSHTLLWWWVRSRSPLHRRARPAHQPRDASAGECGHSVGVQPQAPPGQAAPGGFSQPHRDPFDRLLAAQAELDRLVLLTADPQLSSFPCQTLW
ncbi:MAG: type II toxin-antitoxin system VapC family toxin [Cyanobacteriota bacterium]